MGFYDITWICDTDREGVTMPAPPPDGMCSSSIPTTLRQSYPEARVRRWCWTARLPGWSAADLLEQVQRSIPSVPVLMRDPEATPASAVRLARLGIAHFLGTGEDPFAAIEAVVKEHRSADLARLASSLESAPWDRFLVGSSPEMRQISQIVKLVGARRATVLITGETGTGKELAARALHLAGNRGGSLVAVNCGALPETFLESELFGHVRAPSPALAEPRGALRTGRPRHDFSGRDRRIAARVAKQALACAAGTRGAASGRIGDDQAGRPRGGRHQLRFAGSCGAR